ncbi:hypothetical protein BCV02_14775 [Vibrio breoganii]|uniref:Uncharacterized protein n=1 Tax=Vibrio breoganii TaxID=553239 RepID=A0ABX1UDD5_9VIBR|nr:hypothetical protein [Vibrio breoganii]NMO74799.1 hypothetical protein [Vibrio breoganii]NMR71478.1 hypothetical protein [Vibrio breoganii]PMG00658.1 hypothetical protein BCV02_14775 [Vibrio breoganii]PML54006.1 hypothetical protein BCT73_17065 [Vibrio breoganii]PML84923.1 hypothetical protein BCT67_15730 [Vibrio breoganii]
MSIKPSDWEAFSKIKQQVEETFIPTRLEKIHGITTDESKTPLERLEAVDLYIRELKVEARDMFGVHSKQASYEQLRAMREAGEVTEEMLATLTEDYERTTRPLEDISSIVTYHDNSE